MRPRSGFTVVPRIENSGTFVRPMTIAPASRRFFTKGASADAIRPSKAGTPLGVAWPATSMFSLMVTGTPCNGPRVWPAAMASSAASAADRASSGNSTVMALSSGFFAEIRTRTEATTSHAATYFSRMPLARSLALSCQSFSMIALKFPYGWVDDLETPRHDSLFEP